VLAEVGWRLCFARFLTIVYVFLCLGTNKSARVQADIEDRPTVRLSLFA
jgi:hypothetical protein